MYPSGSKGAELQSFFPVVTKEASRYDDQFKHLNSEFRPHEIGQVPLIGNHRPYNNVFYKINSGEKRAFKQNLNKNAQKREEKSTKDIVQPYINNVLANNKHLQNSLNVDESSVSYEGWSVLTKEDKDRINVKDSQKTEGNDAPHFIRETPLPPPSRPKPKTYKHYKRGQDVINDSYYDYFNRNQVSYEHPVPWQRKHRRHRFNKAFSKHQRRKNTSLGNRKHNRWQRKQARYRQKRIRGNRRHQMYTSNPFARQLNDNIGFSFGVSAPIPGNHYENSPMMMRNAMRRSGGVLLRAKNAFQDLASTWRYTVDETAHILKTALDKTTKRIFHGANKMKRQRDEYNVGYRYGPKGWTPMSPHYTMDYDIDFTPIQNPYSVGNTDNSEKLVTEDKHESEELRGNFVQNQEYYVYDVVGKKELDSRQVNEAYPNISKIFPKYFPQSNRVTRKPNVLLNNTTPHGQMSNIETPFNAHLFEQTPFLRSYVSTSSIPEGTPGTEYYPVSTGPKRPTQQSMLRDDKKVEQNTVKQINGEYKKRENVRNKMRQNPRKKRQPLKIDKNRVPAVRRPNKSSSGYLRNTPRPAKTKQVLGNYVNKDMTAQSREEDLKEVTQAWYSYYRKLKKYRQKYKAPPTKMASERSTPNRFSRNKKMLYPPKTLMMLRNKVDAKMYPPTTLKSTAVLRPPLELHTRWPIPPQARPTLPNSIRDIIHGQHLPKTEMARDIMHGQQPYNVPRPQLASTMQMMAKQKESIDITTPTPLTMVEREIPSDLRHESQGNRKHPEMVEKVETFIPSPQDSDIPSSLEPHNMMQEGTTSNLISEGMEKNNLNSEYTLMPHEYEYIEYEYVDDDDDGIQVYGDILTPAWRVVYTDPSSSLPSSTNKIDSDAEAASPHLEARNITSQEIRNLDQMGTVINDEHKPVNSSVKHSP